MILEIVKVLGGLRGVWTEMLFLGPVRMQPMTLVVCGLSLWLFRDGRAALFVSRKLMLNLPILGNNQFGEKRGTSDGSIKTINTLD